MVPTVPIPQHWLVPGLSLGLVEDGLHADAAGLLSGARHREAQLHVPLVLAQTLLRWKSYRIGYRFFIMSGSHTAFFLPIATTSNKKF